MENNEHGTPSNRSLIATNSEDASPNDTESSDLERAKDEEGLSTEEMAMLASNVESPELVVESKRRSRLLLIALISSLVVSIAIMIIIPPIDGAAPARAKDANFDLVLDEVLKNDGQMPRELLRYAPIQAPIKYTVELEQTAKYETGEPVSVKLTAMFTLEKKTGDPDPRAIMVTLSKVKVELFDGPKDVDLGSIGRMMDDLSLVGKFDTQNGIGRGLPLVRFNPQVARVLYIVSDLLRMVWTKLPLVPVGEGASWELVDSSLSEFKRAASYKYQAGRLIGNLKLLPSQNTQAGEALSAGAADINTRIVDGRVVESSGNIVQEMHIPKAGDCAKTTHFSLKLLEEKN